MHPLIRLQQTLSRWSLQNRSSLNQLAYGKTSERRFRGLRRGNRVEAKFFLLAVAPIVPLLISDHFGWKRGGIWHVWAWFSAAWAVVILGLFLVGLMRAFLASLRR
jgi:hypothetical protein